MGFTRRTTIKGSVAAAGAAAAVSALGLQTLPALAAPSEQALAGGTIVSLVNTPHLWISDESGMLHWGGDTRALQGKTINWNDRRSVTLAQLKTMPMGDPWLSAGLLKMGDPIYLPKWEFSAAQPILYWIQSIADVQIFGINAANYGKFVMDQATWERTLGFSVANLVRDTLPRAT